MNNKKRIRRGGKAVARKFLRPEKGKYKPKPLGPTGLRAPNWNNVNLQPFQKNFYREHPNVMNRLRQDVERFRNKHEITVQGLALNPIESFDEVFMPDYVAREIRNQGYARPTPIQSQTWPIAFSGYNLVGIAQTGSGKTLAYILPAIIHINNQPNIKPGDGPIAVVLAPTRELAVQIQQVAIDFGTSTHIRTACTVGGVDKKPQESDLRKGCEIVVATPGRLLDFLSANVTNMKRCTYLVLDEADRMLDMGFEAQIREIISQIRPDKQILMWSATWPREIRQLAEDFLCDYIQVNIGSLELSANHNIKQFVHICQENEKSAKLQLLLRQIYQANNPGKILIFVSKKKRADMISKYINNFGVACESLHGDKPQSQRTKILDDFRSGRSNIIVATDVAARGLDVDGIMYVINLDFPKLIEDYVHRIGRCGRCDRMGISYAFFTHNDAKQANDLIAILNEANQPVDAKLQEIAFNPKKPEKIDKKQRRINENSGFDVQLPEKHRHDSHNANFTATGPGFDVELPEKRRHDSHNANFTATGPSSSSVRRSYAEGPQNKRVRILDPEPSHRQLMFNQNSDRDFMDERNIDRGSAVSCLGGVDDQNIGLRQFEDRLHSNQRDFVRNQPADTHRPMERRRDDFESELRGRGPDLDRMDFRMTRNDIQRGDERGDFQRDDFQRDHFQRDDFLRDDIERSMNFGRNLERSQQPYGIEQTRGVRDSSRDLRANEFSRLNDFNERSNDIMPGLYFNDDERRDILNDSNVSRSSPMFNPISSERRPHGMEDNFSNRAYGRNASPGFRRTTPDPMLDRSDVNSDRMSLNQSRDEDPFESFRSLGRSRDKFLDHSNGSRFDMDNRRNERDQRFTEIIQPQSTSGRWNEFDFGSRDLQDRRGLNDDLQDRRNFNNQPDRRDFDNQQNRRDFNNLQDRRDFTNETESRRMNDIGFGRETNFNFARNNEYGGDDEFQQRNRRDLERRNMGGRFNRFN